MSNSSRISLEEEYRDCLQEITNIAMGQAADKLARFLDVFIVLPVPNVNLLEASELTMALQSISHNDRVSAVCQGFIGSGIAGEAMLIFNDSSFHDIAKLTSNDHITSDKLELEVLMDTANILIGAFLMGFAEQLEVQFSCGHPSVLGRHVNVEDLIKVNSARWKETLTIEINYTIEGSDISCDLLLLFTDDSVKILKQKADYLLE